MKTLVLGTAATIAFGPRVASAEISVQSGIECMRMTDVSYNATATSFDHFDEDGLTGLANMDRSRLMFALCPLSFRNSKEQGAPYVQFTNTAFGRKMFVTTVDQSTTGSVSCSMGGQSGRMRWYAPAGSSCGLWGLCDVENPSYTTQPPYRGSDGIIISTLPDQYYLHLFLVCRIPALAPPYGGHDASGISGYRLYYNADQ